ncbi:hypothetical protein HF086_017041 [Spodoptera exigua]|uniref:Uncharacterized protein n=1 Tax=Spodoptera exigua TaxID=7107 RepID=A0A922SD58_SPOEX|nr:hypothetical protein HF086_017041 [Spodoptera exigua]
MDERQIEDMLMRLENGEISEDDLESDGEDIPYYPSREALAAELEDDEEVLTGENNLEEFPDPPLVQDEQPIQDAQSSEQVEAQATESLINLRHLLWKKQSFPFDENNVKFVGSEELPSSIMELQSPYQFFNYFSRISLWKTLLLNQLATQSRNNLTDPNYSQWATFANILGSLYSCLCTIIRIQGRIGPINLALDTSKRQCL